MSSQTAHRYLGPLKAVVLDWAGTTVDHGCMAPVATFMQAFAETGVPITVAEARAPMGMPKWHHIQAITRDGASPSGGRPSTAKRPDDSDVDALYQRFLPLQVKTVEQHSDVIPGVVETVAALRARGLAIASTTGYPREVMDVVVRVAKEQGYEPDVTICAGDTPAGRPGPFMALQALIKLSISPVEAVVKIGDTAVDIERRSERRHVVGRRCRHRQRGRPHRGRVRSASRRGEAQACQGGDRQAARRRSALRRRQPGRRHAGP